MYHLTQSAFRILDTLLCWFATYWSCGWRYFKDRSTYKRPFCLIKVFLLCRPQIVWCLSGVCDLFTLCFYWQWRLWSAKVVRIKSDLRNGQRNFDPRGIFCLDLGPYCTWRGGEGPQVLRHIVQLNGIRVLRQWGIISLFFLHMRFFP